MESQASIVIKARLYADAIPLGNTDQKMTPWQTNFGPFMKGIYFLFPIFLCACSSTRVTYDYDQSIDYSNYTTYGYYPDLMSGLTPLDDKRLFRVLERELRNKGFKFSEDPDFYVDIASDVYVYQAGGGGGLNLGMAGGTGAATGGGVSLGIPVNGTSLRRTILFAFVDAKRDYLFWKGTSNSSFQETLPPLKKERRLAKVVHKVLKKYPPKIKRKSNAPSDVAQ